MEVRARARELLPGRDVRPGFDYALTEAVRCKSRGEAGVADALETCSSRYLRRTLEQSGSQLVVVLGRHAAWAVSAQLGVPARPRLHPDVSVGGKARAVVFMPHPNARVARSFAAVLGKDGLALLRARLA
ncbi:MAG: uracil-DNA glycosylase family protein [Gaiellaceae bacterium]